MQMLLMNKERKVWELLLFFLPRMLFLAPCFSLGIFFWLFRAVPTAYGGSQAKSRIGAVAASLHHSHSNTLVVFYPAV